MPLMKLWAGRLGDRGEERFLVVAEDEIDAGRFATATVGEPASVEEIEAEGVVASWGADGRGRVVPSLAVERRLVAAPLGAR